MIGDLLTPKKCVCVQGHMSTGIVCVLYILSLEEEKQYSCLLIETSPLIRMCMYACMYVCTFACMYWKKVRPLSGPKWEKMDKVAIDCVK